MFTDVISDVIGIPSQRIRSKNHVDGGTLTDGIELRSSEVQSYSTSDAQVEALGLTHAVADKDGSEANIFKVLAFLEKAAPRMEKELKQATSSHAFDGYVLLDDVAEKSPKVLHSLNSGDISGMMVTGLSWNHMGTVLGAVYSAESHDNWCDHIGHLATWGITRSNFDGKKPTRQQTAKCCITGIAYHPLNPAIVATSTYNGEIMIWDFNNEDEPLLESSLAIMGTQKEPFTSLKWIRNFLDVRSQNQLLVSTGLDGRILLWGVNVTTGGLKVLRGYIVESDGITIPGHLVHHQTYVGILSIDFNPQDSSQCIVGCEGGVLAFCSLVSEKLAEGSFADAGLQLRNPVWQFLHPHVGNVTGVSWCPFSSDLVASCGIDGDIQIFNLKESVNPMVSIIAGVPCMSLVWSPARPLVLYVGNAKSEVFVFDLKQSHSNPTMILSTPELSGIVNALAFSAHSMKLLAAGSSKGNCVIWKLTEDLTSQQGQEMALLNDLMKSLDQQKGTGALYSIWYLYSLKYDYGNQLNSSQSFNFQLYLGYELEHGLGTQSGCLIAHLFLCMKTVMGLFGKSEQKSPKDQVREWCSRLRKEGIQREEDKVKKTLKDAAKKGDKDVCLILAKEIIHSRKAIGRIHIAQANLKSVEYQMQNQLATLRIAGSLQKSTDVMKAMHTLIKVPEVAATMQDLSKEMMRAGIMEEMMDDTMESALGDTDEMEEEAQQEIDKILWELTAGQLGQAPKAPKDQLPAAAEKEAEASDEENEEELSEMRSRLAALRS
ncbi:unnamed protein product [Darwinula stevensoni]|uniref:Uncharacterized protein n=1 Tax=Darwinula stevensoni TaxID=69355 RepID=A0A7R9FR17_9CRUS|nr:unnamed protein product [Darwinula stevensoni]CAG0900187.1 unnamed protein product [Darwinula stevensoni]